VGHLHYRCRAVQVLLVWESSLASLQNLLSLTYGRPARPTSHRQLSITCMVLQVWQLPTWPLNFSAKETLPAKAAIGFRIFSPKQTQLQHLPPANCSEPPPRIHSFCVARLHVACRFPHLQTQNIHLPTRPKIQTQLKICSSIGGWKTLVPATAIVPISPSKCYCGVLITSASNLMLHNHFIMQTHFPELQI
jgi:hypothetical protein